MCREDRAKLDADSKELERQRREFEDAKIALQKRDFALGEEKRRVEQWALDERAKLERWAQDLTTERERERERTLAALNAASAQSSNPPSLPPHDQPYWTQGHGAAPLPHHPAPPAAAPPSMADRYAYIISSLIVRLLHLHTLFQMNTCTWSI